MYIWFQEKAAQATESAENAGKEAAESLSFQETIIKSLNDFWQSIVEHMPYVVVGLLVLVATKFAASGVGFVVGKFLDKSKFRRSLKSLFSQLAIVLVWVVGVIAASMVMFPSFTPGKLLATLGLGSIAVGFAFKDIFENFFAGILILWRFPFEPGDTIRCGDIVGVLESTTIRMTEIRQADGQLAVVPNADILKNSTFVLTSRPYRRIEVTCGVAYDSDVNEARDVIQDAVSSCETVNTEKPVQVFMREMGDSSLNYQVTWWAAPRLVDYRESRDEVLRRIKIRLDEAGIEIPFPQRDLRIRDASALADLKFMEAAETEG